MSRRMIVSLLPLLFCAAAHASDAGHPRVSADQCGLSTPYNVLVDTGGVWLYRDAGSPREVFFHAGELSVDKHVQAISDADAQRLRELESQARQLMPDAADLARDTVHVGFDALAAVVEALTGSERKARKLAALRTDSIAHVDATLGTGRWDQDSFDDEFAERMEDAAQSLAGSISRSVLWTVFTGGGDRIEQRTQKMEASLNASLEARTQAIEAHAERLCARARDMEAVQAALDYRYDGQPLRILEMSPTRDATAARTP